MSLVLTSFFCSIKISLSSKGLCAEMYLLSLIFKIFPSSVDDAAKKRFLCTICEESFEERYQLKYHEARHNLQKCEIKCYYCDKGFYTVDDLDTHLAVHHKQSRFVCPECKQCFTNKVPFMSHIKSHQEGLCENIPTNPEEKNTCKICNRNFTDRRAWTKHLKLHTQASQLHRCEECKKDFCAIKDLKRHLIISHRGTSVVCPHCEKAFREMRNFLRHIKIHDKDYSKETFRCGECNKICGTKTGLKLHMNNGHQKATHICNICGKTLSSSWNLNKHFKLHIEPRIRRELTDKNKKTQKEFTCELCGKIFQTRGRFNLHMNKHIKGKKALQKTR